MQENLIRSDKMKHPLKNIIIEPITKNFKMPEYASDGDSGMDVFSTVDALLMPGMQKRIPLGFKIQIPDHPYHKMGYRWEAQARPRSGISMKTKIRVSNSPGTIDNFYIDEVGILVEILWQMPRDTHVPYAFDFKGRAVMLDYIRDNTYIDNYIPDKVPFGTYVILKGDKIAQLVFNEVVRPLDIVIGKVDPNKSRGGGWGHSDDIQKR
jgi:dUTP pyrophosphatase